jgi:hypothetical protein
MKMRKAGQQQHRDRKAQRSNRSHSRRKTQSNLLPQGIPAPARGDRTPGGISRSADPRARSGAGAIPGFGAGAIPGFGAGAIPGFGAGAIPGFGAGAILSRRRMQVKVQARLRAHGADGVPPGDFVLPRCIG